MIQMDEILEYEHDVGYLLMHDYESSDMVGEKAQFGWAAIYDVSSRLDLAANSIIVAIWPDDTMRVEGFKDAALASFRWMQWEETFRLIPSEIPKRGDMIVLVEDDRLIEANTGLIFASFDGVMNFTRKTRLVQRGRKLWFLDQPFGNYYPIDLS